TGVIGLSADDIDRVEAGHAQHDPGDGWGSVPMPAGFAMLPAEMLLRPTVTPRRITVTELPAFATRSSVVRLADGDTLTLTAGVVRKRIHGSEQLMYAF